MDYLNFDLRLGDWDHASRTGVVEVLSSPAGEGARLTFSLGKGIPANMSPGVSLSADDLGKHLAQGVLTHESLALWHESYQIARLRDRGLRLRLHAGSWALSRLPWELLYDERRGDFLVFDPRVSLVRYVRLHAVPPSLRRSESLKVLVVIASPSDLVELEWEREISYLRDGLWELVRSRRVEVVINQHTTHENLHTALLENAPDVVHYIGHGEYDAQAHRGTLVLEDEEGHASPIGATETARLVRRYGARLVVLNACETASGAWAGLGPALVRAEVPAVVAMQWPVEDRAAIRFSRSFYTALARGRTIDECVAEGRMGASASNSAASDWAAPVLFLRSLTGQLWPSAGSHGEDTRVRRRPRPPHPAPPHGGRAAPAGKDGDGSSHIFYSRTRGPLSTLRDMGFLVDRPELRRAMRIAQQSSISQYIALLGARQTGKTTLLLQLRDLLRDSYACVYVDLSVLRAQSAHACSRFVVFRLVSEFRSLLGTDFFLPDAQHIESAVDAVEYLRQLAAVVPTPRIILLLDEVGGLSKECSDPFFNMVRTIFTQGRGLSSPLAKYLFVFGGAVDLYGLTSEATSPLNICEKLYLSDFDCTDVEEIVSRFRRMEVPVSRGAGAQVYELTGGHPYLTMRLCALMESAQEQEINRRAIQKASELMLVEDDNIRYLIRELGRRPAERRRLGSILEGTRIAFSRNDPVLASLEMLGAIRAVQPAQVRNLLYERALRAHYAHGDHGESSEGDGPGLDGTENDLGDLYARLQELRLEAIDETGVYTAGPAWEAFAAALFSMIPAFSIYPEARADGEAPAVIVAIDRDAPTGSYWGNYEPAILLQCSDLRRVTPDELVNHVLAKARRHNIHLAFVMSTGGESLADEDRARCSGALDDTCMALIDDSEIAELLASRGDFDGFLRSKVLDARLRRL